MDFEIGNIFYIVITLVAVIVGLLGKKKKPASQGAGKTDGEAKPGFLENLERAFNLEQEGQGVVDIQEYEEDLPVEEALEEPAPEPVSGFRSIMEEYEQMQSRRTANMDSDTMTTVADSLTEPLKVIKLDHEEGTDYFKVIKDFDAGTAIVYSSIINRIDY